MDRNSNKETLHQFILCFKPYKKLILSAFFFAVLASILESLFPLTFKLVIDNLLNNSFHRMIPIIFAFWALIFIVITSSVYVCDYTLTRLAYTVGYNLRKALFNHLQSVTLYFFHSHRAGKLMARVLNDVETIENTVKNDLKNLLVQPLILFICFLMMLFLDWRLFIISAIVFPFFTSALRLVQFKLSGLSRLIVDIRAKINAYLQELFSSMHIVKAYGREEKEKKIFDVSSQEYLNQRLKDSKIKIFFGSSIGLIYSLNLLVVCYVGFILVIHNLQTIGGLVAFIFYQAVLKGRFMTMVESYISLKQSVAIFSGLKEIKEGDLEDSALSACRPLKLLGGVEFSGVWFNYFRQKDWVIKNANISINPGDKVVIIGKNGVGKTTLMHLLLRFYIPDKGDIFVDGINTKELDVSFLRSNIAIVSQDDVLFSGTIRENISYGKQEATEEEIVSAAKLAQANDFIISLPEGYHSQIGERWVKLSGGERQRISIARAILKNPRILIFDEATCYMNSDSEFQMYKSLDDYIKEKTVFIITHDISNVKTIATKTLFFNNGIIEELSSS